jgi:hypothetical protein
MLERIYVAVSTRAEGLLGRMSEHGAWLPRGVALAVALSLLITFPRISFFLGNDEQIVNFWPFIEQQAHDPLKMNSEFYAGTESSHESKRVLRLTLPIIMRVLHADWRVVLALQAVLGVMMLYLVGRIAWQLFGDRVVALASVFGVSAIFAGKAAFLQLGGMGDAFAYAFFTIAAAWRNGPVIAASIFAACFTDERAILAAPLLAVYWAFRDKPAPVWLNRQSVLVVLAIAAALLVRLYLRHAYGLYVPIGAGRDAGLDVLPRTLLYAQYLLPHVLAGLWLWPLVSGMLLVRHRQRLALAVLAGAVIVLAGVSFMVLDVDRSLSYLLPIVYVAMAIVAAYRLPLADVRTVAILGALVSLTFPVNNLFSGDSRYSAGNLLPVELVRFYAHLQR